MTLKEKFEEIANRFYPDLTPSERAFMVAKFCIVTEEWLEQKRKVGASENRGDNLDDDYRVGQSDILDGLSEDIK